MAHAERCPVCGGVGGFGHPNNDEEERLGREKWTRWVDCHGCGGKGWVEVSDSSYDYSLAPACSGCGCAVHGGTVLAAAGEKLIVFCQQCDAEGREKHIESEADEPSDLRIEC